MPDWTTYKGIEVPDATPTGAAGEKLKDDLLLLADRAIASVCCGRLTLESGVPISISNQGSKTTVYFTPYMGAEVGLYDGTNWNLYEFSQLSVAVPSTTDTNFDVFLYDNSGTLTLETVDWTDGTTRATALTTQDGIYVKSGAATRRYLGTGRTMGTSGQTEDTDAKRYLWNYYHRVPRRLYRTQAAAHTYGTAVNRAWNNSTANRVHTVQGLREDSLSVFISNNGSLRSKNSFAVDNTTSDYTLIAALSADSPSSMILGNAAEIYLPDIGYHYIQVIERGTISTSYFYRFVLFVRFMC